MLSLGLYSAASLLTVAGALGCLVGRINDTAAYGMCTVGMAFAVVGGVIGSPSPLTPLWAAAGAYHGWMWWNSGGGDDTKHRPRRLGRRFQGVRRTAPQGA